jgi:large subunit ribosomal protein L20
MRIKRGSVARSRRKKVLKLAKGFRGSGHRLFRVAAKMAIIKGGVKALQDRHKKKAAFKAIWSQRISAALNPFNISYSKFIGQLNKANVKLDRKILAELAVSDIDTFNKIVEKVKA